MQAVEYSPRALRPMTSLADIERAVAESDHHPVLIFKHSATCGISAYAYEEIEAWLGQRPSERITVALVDVHANRDVARAVSARWNVRHESPQILLVHGGLVPWHTSHSGVTATAIDRALMAVGTGMAQESAGRSNP